MMYESIRFAGLGEGHEDGRRDQDLEDGTEENGQGSNTQANQMLVQVEGNGLEGLSSELDARELHGEGHQENDDKQRVVEEVGEDVELGLLQLPGVDLIEDLHQHEGVEEDAVVLAGLVGPFSHTDRGLDSEDLRACIEQGVPLKRMAPRTTIWRMP